MLACGGKTSLEDAADFTGGTAETGGRANTAGSAGSGGNAAGSSGRGGSGGTAADAGSNESKIQVICTAARAAGCDSEACEADLLRTEREVRGYGSSPSSTQSSTARSRSAPTARIARRARAPSNHAWLCYQDGYYCANTIQSEDSCSTTCRNWGARCEPGPSGPRCACTSGPNAGHEFPALHTCSSGIWVSGVRAECQPMPL